MQPWPDVEDLLADVLTDLGHTGSETPADLAERLPWIRITRVGGADDRVTDTPRVQVLVHAATRAEAMALARAAQQRLISGPLRIPGAGVVDRARTDAGPQRIPHPNSKVQAVLAVYRVSLRRLR